MMYYIEGKEVLCRGGHLASWAAGTPHSSLGLISLM